ncbi:MAG: hypothetical protein AAB316_03665 [Bacteroidota bacterium]
MITDFYPLQPNADKREYYFESEGPNGVFQKVVLFEELPLQPGYFNLALCVVSHGIFLDDVVTDNADFSKTMQTVAKATYDFLEELPEAIIRVEANENRRLRIYNGIVKRRWKEIESLFEVKGKRQQKFEAYNPDHFYDGFELRLKKP